MIRDTGYLAFSITSGCLWALIALLIGYRAFGVSIWGGVLVSPLIGLLISALSVRFHARWRRGRALFSLVTLYLAASLFGLSVSLYDVFIRGVGPGPNVENIFSGVLATLWGLTIGGYFVILWPLAYLNHKLLWLKLD